MGNHADTYNDNLSFLMRIYARLCGFNKRPNVRPWKSLLRLVEILDKKDLDIVFTGSYFDGLRIPRAQEVKLEEKNVNAVPTASISDVDFMIVNRKKPISLDKEDELSYAYLSSGDCHPGYVLLKRTDTDEFVTHDEITREVHTKSNLNMFYTVVKGTPPSSHKNPVSVEVEYAQKEQHGPALSFEIVKSTDVINFKDSTEVDLVAALRCSKWPPQADEWCIRERNSGWPATNIIGEIVDHGCHLVPVCHRNSKHTDTEFRLSFSHAEKVLSHSLADIQRVVYIIGKVLYYHHLKPLGIISSYHLKTCFFWMCEEYKETEWTWDKIGPLCVSLLKKLWVRLDSKTLQNYFVKDNNMLDHIQEKDLLKVSEVLKDLIRDPIRCLSTVAPLYKPELEIIAEDVRTVFCQFNESHSTNEVQSLMSTILMPVYSNIAKQDIINDHTSSLTQACVAQLLIGFEKDIDQVFFDILRGLNSDDEQEVNIELFTELQELLEKNGAQRLALCLLVTSMLTTVVFSQIYKCSRRRVKILGAATESLLERHQPNGLCQHYHEGCQLIMQYIFTIEDIIYYQKNKSEVSEKLNDKVLERTVPNNNISLLLQANYLIKQQEFELGIDSLTTILENCSDDDMHLKLKSMDLICEYDMPIQDQIIRLLDEIRSGTFPQSSIAWCGIISSCLSLSAPVRCVARYLLVISNEHQYEECCKNAIVMADMWPVHSDCVDSLLLVGHALYIAKRYEKAVLYFASILEYSACPAAVVYLLLCNAHMSQEIQLSHQMKTSKAKALTLSSMRHLINAFKEVSINDGLNLVHFMKNQGNKEIIFLSLARSFELQLLSNGNIGDLDSSNVIYDLTYKCYELALKDSKTLEAYCFYISFLSNDQTKNTGDVINAITDCINTKRVTDKRFVQFHGQEMNILPKYIQDELCLFKSFTVPSDLFLFLLLCKAMSVNILDKDGPNLKQRQDYYIELTPTVDSILSVMLDRKQIKKNVYNWLRLQNQGIIKFPDGLFIGKICSQILRSQMLSQPLQNQIGSAFAEEEDSTDRLKVKSQSALLSSHCRFRKGHFKMAFGLYRMFMDGTKNVCVDDECSPQLHYSSIIWTDAMDDPSEDIIKLSIHCLKYLIENECTVIPLSHLQHIKVLFALLCFFRHNQLENLSDDEAEARSKEEKTNVSKLDYFYVPGTQNKGKESIEDQMSRQHTYLFDHVKADEIEELNNFDLCIETLQEVLSAGDVKSGLAHTLLGNVLHSDGRLKEALKLLGVAIDVGITHLPIYLQFKNPHHLLKDSRKFPCHALMKCHKLFELVVPADKDGYYPSYVVYATFLHMVTCAEDNSSEAEVMIQVYKIILKKVGTCAGKNALFGIVCLKLKEFAKAKTAFEEEIKADSEDATKKRTILQGFVAVSHYLDIIAKSDESQAKEMCEEWLDQLMEYEGTLEKTEEMRSYSLEEDVSAALFIYQRWCDNDIISAMSPEDKLQILQYLSDLLIEDAYGGYLLTGIGNIYLQNFQDYAHDDKQRSDLISKIDDLFKKAEHYEDFLVYAVSWQFSCLLMKQGKYDLTLEWGLKSHTESLKTLQEYITDPSSNTPQMVEYVLTKCLPKSELITNVPDCLLGNAPRALERIAITYSVVEVITEKEEDLCTHALRCAEELLLWKDLDAVINMYECMVDTYGQTKYSSLLMGNLACYLFEKLMADKEKCQSNEDKSESNKQSETSVRQSDESSKQSNESSKQSDESNKQNDESNKQSDDASRQRSESSEQCDEFKKQRDRIASLLILATANPFSLGTYACHLNFLYHTSQYDEFKRVLQLASDPNYQVSGVTKLAWLERHTIDQYLRKELDHHSTIAFDSWQYCTYLDICHKLKENKNTDISVLETQTKSANDIGSWRLLAYVYMMKGDKGKATDCFSATVSQDASFKWLLEEYAE